MDSRKSFIGIRLILADENVCLNIIINPII